MKNNTNKLLFLIVAYLLRCTATYAYDFKVGGIYYSIVSLPDLTCEVSSGDNKYEGKVTIPATVTYNNRTLTVKEIGYRAFEYCRALTSISIPNSVTSIGSNAFYDCSGLTSVNIGNSVTEIGSNAFYNCSGLTSISIPNSVTKIGNYAFYDCSGLTSVNIGNSVTSIGSSAFEYCSGLTSISIPNSVTKIGNYAFYKCSGLTSVSIPNSVTSIGEWVFRGCSGLTSVSIPNSVTSIGSNAFYNCSGLTSISIPNSVTSIGSSAFYNCRGLTSVSIPNSVTKIGNDAFEGCSNLKRVIIEDGVFSLDMSEITKNNNSSYIFYSCPIEYLYIGRNLRLAISYYDHYSPFYNLSTLKEVVIGDSVTTLNDYLFYKCTNLAKVVTGSSIASIPQIAFRDCDSITSFTLGKSVSSVGSMFSNYTLTELYSLNLTPPSVGSSNFSNKEYMDTKVYVPQEALEAYQKADVWKNFWNLQALEPTAIKATEANYGTDLDTNAVAYDLNGNRVEDWQSKKGVYIVNGKKVAVK